MNKKELGDWRQFLADFGDKKQFRIDRARVEGLLDHIDRLANRIEILRKRVESCSEYCYGGHECSLSASQVIAEDDAAATEQG